MAALVVAGEAVFGLPFHITRFFRHQFLDVFGYSQTQIGTAQSIYGIAAMVSYPIGGILADRFSVRKLLASSLLVTGMSGFYLMTKPSYTGLCVVYGFWGVSTILPFWAALIKATRAWGGHTQQGTAFGILDGGRGLFAFVLAEIALLSYGHSLPEEVTSALQKTTAVQSIVATYTYACFVAAALVMLLLPSERHPPGTAQESRPSFSDMLGVLRLPAVWLQAVIIMCAYSMFKATDFYGQYARDIWHWTDAGASQLSTVTTIARPVAAVACGLLADRISSSLALVGCYLLCSVSFVAMVLLPPADSAAWMLMTVVLSGCIGVFAMRGIYFALLEESSIPAAETGAAVGVISLLGFTPDIFMPRISGGLLDHWHGERTGYVALYGLLAGIGLLGVVTSAALNWLNRRHAATSDQAA